MIRLRLLVGLSLLVSVASVSAQQIYVVDRDQVNIRSDATTQSRQVAALRRGVEVEQVDRHAGWLRIQLSDGTQGWIHGQLVLPRFLISGQGVRLREGPSTARTSVTMLFRGQQVDRVGAEQDGWSQIRIADGRTGWLATRFLKPKTTADSAVPAQAEPDVDAEPLLETPLPEPDPMEETTALVQRNPYAEGLQREAGGDHLGALQAFEEVLTGDAENVNALFHAAKAHRQLGEHDAALTKLYTALRVSGGRRDIYLTLGEVYRLQARPDSAAKYQALFRGETWPPPLPRTQGAIGEVTQAPSQVVGGDDAAMEEEEAAGNPLDGPWVLIGLAGVGLLALAGVTWWVVNTSQKRPQTPASKSSPPKPGPPEKAAGGKFSQVWEEQVDEAGQGRATTEEEESLDRQIDEKWSELRQGAGSFADGGEETEVDGILDQVDGLRQTLDGQDDRNRLYADIVRLQNMKIEAMTEEIRRLRGRR
ncbi:MAG: SH3 domain-containing protein [Gemmatimonadetes bacterium]|jgi:uncharacterized protein YgiM (DUF1202 family)|nr:SH3 domain-containing protein [Gemmatimonadota bacterium]MBT5060478.1 SH3 domain-containing protein [Gemmatimonadota bacterium]MBT5142551.1 SH3 domain-containing protein [Gemmatimonadota bacterium]MBT5587184.1 SH3 domain-containing protein [Gemmatimonadota bacterium]MBT5961152.1 SH3 domain-containing protein [Gemmatimonadota bacterium]